MFNLRNFIKDMFNKKEYVDDKKNYPLVVYENDIVKKEIDKWVNHLGAKSFRQVLLDIGFSESDVVYIYNKNNKPLEYYYSVNDRKINTSDYIKINYDWVMAFGSMIDIYNGSEFKRYEFIDNNFDSDKNSFMLSLEQKRISFDKYYERDYYSDVANFVVKDREYKFIFCLGNLTSKDNVNSLKLNNEDKLCEYLCSLSFPVDVIDVYKNIVSICDIDVRWYDLFEVKSIPNKVGAKEDVFILHRGEFSEIKITKDGKRICLNCNDVWEYENINDAFLVMFSMNSSNNNVSYKVSGVNDKVVDSYTLGLLKSNISTARSEVEDTKKLVRSMFNNK